MKKKKVFLVGLTLVVLVIVATVSARPSILGGLTGYIPCIYTDEWAIFESSQDYIEYSDIAVDMNNTSVEIKLLTACDLVITLSTECYAYSLLPKTSHVRALPSEGPRASSPGYVSVYCLVGDLFADGPVWLTSDDTMNWETRTATFILNDVPAGTYTVKIQWKTSCDHAGVWYRSLNIIANGAGHL